MNKITSYTLEEARKKLESYCAYQERCHKEVDRKLDDMNVIPLVKEEIILYLLQHDFLNEERFAKSFARGKFIIKRWGKVRITRELKLRDISKYNIEVALKEISIEDYTRTFNVLSEKKCASIKESNIYKKRKKLADYLLYRGWESELVYQKIRELIS